MLTDIYETGPGTNLWVPESLDQDIQGSARGSVGQISERAVGDLKCPVCAGARLSREMHGVGCGSWRAAVSEAGHGGRSTLEYQKMHPEEADAIHVLFSGF